MAASFTTPQIPSDGTGNGRRLLESEYVPCLLWHIDGRITDANDAFLRLIGYSRSELSRGTLRWADITPQEYAADDASSLKELLETGVTRPQRKEYIRKDGRRIPVTIVGGKFESGQSGYAICTPHTPVELPQNTAAWAPPPPMPHNQLIDDSHSDDFLPVPVLRRLGVGLCLFAMGMATVALAGWLSNRLTLASLHVDFIPMAPLTAVCLWTLAAAVLGALAQVKLARTASLFVGMAVGAVGGAVLVRLALGNLVDFESFLITAAGQFGAVPAGRMSPLTACSLLALGSATSMLASPRHWRREAVGHLAIAVVLICSLVMLGYCYGAPLLYGGTIIPMALTTGLALLALSLAVICANSREYYPLRPLSGSSTRSLLLRAFLPVAPLVVATDSLFNRMLPIQNPALHSAILVVISTIVIVIVIVQAAARIAARMDRIEAHRRHAEQTRLQYAHALERQAGLLDLAHSAIIVRDFKHIIRFWNRGAEEIYGHSREYALGRSVVELLKPVLPEGVTDAEQELRATGHWQGEIVYRDAAGEARVMSTAAGTAAREIKTTWEGES